MVSALRGFYNGADHSLCRNVSAGRKSKPETKYPQDKIEVQDTYVWMWHGWPDETTEKGEILQLENHHLKFSFGKAGNVTVRVKEDRGQSILELQQNEIPVDEISKSYYHIGCTKGWVFYLSNLKSLLEGGIDLRNRDTNQKDVVNS